MKTLKRTLSFVLLSAIVCFASENIFAQAHPHPHPALPVMKKEHARRSIQKTAFVIKKARMKVKEGKVYTGNLAKAVRHQKYAKQLYLAGKYNQSVYFSRRARALAIAALKANKGAATTDMSDSKDESDIVQGAPTDEQLDEEVSKAMPAEPQKDEDSLNDDSSDVSLKDDQ